MPTVTIYSTATCGFCKMLKSYLHSKDIEFKEKHVDEDPNLAKELMDVSHQMGVPFSVIEEDGKEDVKILGYDRPKFDQALGL